MVTASRREATALEEEEEEEEERARMFICAVLTSKLVSVGTLVSAASERRWWRSA